MKKTIFFSFLLICMVFMVGARELPEESLETQPTGLTASTDAATELNSSKCAQIKVSLPKEGANSRLEGPLTPKSNAATTESSTSTLDYDGYEAVDLGLSVKWAACNVGAEKPSDYGNYYAWGETTTKSKYTPGNSVTYGKNINNIEGNHHDVAHNDWGDGWRIPTTAEFRELIDKCTWQWTTMDGHKGYTVTGLNGNSIFLPAAGYRLGGSGDGEGSRGGYWSSTPNSNERLAWELVFPVGGMHLNASNRSYGRSIRPVTE